MELHTALREQVETVRLTGEELRRQTGALASALRKPQVRGRWGELHLARAAELAGLVDRCDVTYQHTAVDTGDDDDTVRRPDLVVNLAGGKHVVVDAKVPLDAYLEASAIPFTAQGAEAARRRTLLEKHVKAVRAHVDALAKKTYWAGLPSSPEFAARPGKSAARSHSCVAVSAPPSPVGRYRSTDGRLTPLAALLRSEET